MKKNEAEGEKEKGNACMKEKKYAEAMFHYTAAIKSQPKNHTLYSNRSFAFKNLDQYYYAIEDARKAIELCPTWAKGYYRLGEFNLLQNTIGMHYGHTSDLLLQQALNFSPDDEALKQSVIKAKQHLNEQISAEKRIPIYGICVGALLGVCIVLADVMSTDKPVLKHMILQTLLVSAVAAVGYGGALSYSFWLCISCYGKGFGLGGYFARTQRHGIIGRTN